MKASSPALEIRRRELEEQQRLLQEHQARLCEELGEKMAPPSPDLETQAALPVWKNEADESLFRSSSGPTPLRRGALARERQRERTLFFACAAILVLMVALVLWVWHTLRGG